MQEGDRHEQARCEGGRNRGEGEVNTEKAQRVLGKSDKEKAAWGRGGWRAAGKMNGVQASEGPPLSGRRVFLCEIYEAQCGDKKKQRVGTAELRVRETEILKRKRGGSRPVCTGLGIQGLLELPACLHEATNVSLAWRCGYSVPSCIQIQILNLKQRTPLKQEERSLSLVLSKNAVGIVCADLNISSQEWN